MILRHTHTITSALAMDQIIHGVSHTHFLFTCTDKALGLAMYIVGGYTYVQPKTKCPCAICIVLSEHTCKCCVYYSNIHVHATKAGITYNGKLVEQNSPMPKIPPTIQHGSLPNLMCSYLWNYYCACRQMQYYFPSPSTKCYCMPILHVEAYT